MCQRKSGELYMEKERCRTTTIAADKYRSYRLFFILDPFCFGFFLLCVCWPSVIGILLVIAAFGLNAIFFVCFFFNSAHLSL